jgi:hypothetical protein
MGHTDAPIMTGPPYILGDIRVTLPVMGVAETSTVNGDPLYARTLHFTYRTDVGGLGFYLQAVSVAGVYVYRPDDEPETVTRLKVVREFPAPNLHDLPAWLIPLVRQYEPAPLDIALKDGTPT